MKSGLTTTIAISFLVCNGFANASSSSTDGESYNSYTNIEPHPSSDLLDHYIWDYAQRNPINWKAMEFLDIENYENISRIKHIGYYNINRLLCEGHPHSNTTLLDFDELGRITSYEAGNHTKYYMYKNEEPLPYMDKYIRVSDGKIINRHFVTDEYGNTLSTHFEFIENNQSNDETLIHTLQESNDGFLTKPLNSNLQYVRLYNDGQQIGTYSSQNPDLDFFIEGQRNNEREVTVERIYY